MIEFAENKSIAESEGVTAKDVTVKAVSAARNEYHFAGSGKWKPVSVLASTIDEATELWKQARQALESVEPEKTNTDE